MANKGFSGFFGLIAACLAGMAVVAADRAPAAPQPSGSAPLAVEVLDSAAKDPSVDAVAGGSLDGRFGPFRSRGSHLITSTLWFRLAAPSAATVPGTPVLWVRSGRDQPVEVFGHRGGALVALTPTTFVPRFGGAQDTVFTLAPSLDPGAALYARVGHLGGTTTDLQFGTSTLEYMLRWAAAHARIIAQAFGALIAMSLCAVLVRFLLTDRLYPLYGALFSLQALYLAYFSGEGFHWPLLGLAHALGNYAWNVPIAVSGAAAALIFREFDNLRMFSIRV